MSERLAIIGAGPSGLSVMRAFRLAELQGQKIPEIVCFEKQEDWGGLWNYTWRTGTDQYGDTVHSSMYLNMWSNNPKEIIELPDYTFMEHFGKPIPSFLPRVVLLDYILGRAKKSDIRHLIKFNMSIESVEHKNDKFNVKIWNKKDNHVFSEVFDYVIVASGHFSVPHIPEYKGVHSFPGRIIHSHDFRNAEQFKGQDVLIIGSKLSAEDIAVQCWKYGTKSVTIAYRKRPLGFKWPEGITERHTLDHFEGKTAVFQDGFHQNADAIIYCTGYLFHFPFMEDKLKLQSKTHIKYCPGLYKGVVCQNNHKLFYMGMTCLLYPLINIDIQAWFVRDVILETIVLPSEEDIQRDISFWMEREESSKGFDNKVVFQTDYLRDLLTFLSCYSKPNFDLLSQYYSIRLEHKNNDILSYRDNSYMSAATGILPPNRAVKWIDAKSLETLETFLESELI